MNFNRYDQDVQHPKTYAEIYAEKKNMLKTHYHHLNG